MKTCKRKTESYESKLSFYSVRTYSLQTIRKLVGRLPREICDILKNYCYSLKYKDRRGLTSKDHAAYLRLWYSEHLESERKRSRDKIEELHFKALKFLGNKCVVCGETDIRVLCIDHINGNGGKERRKLRQHGVYRRVLIHPEDYQILCCNHNKIKQWELHEFAPRK